MFLQILFSMYFVVLMVFPFFTHEKIQERFGFTQLRTGLIVGVCWVIDVMLYFTLFYFCVGKGWL